MGSFDVEGFVASKVSRMRDAVGNERALVAVSGGVDSTTCAVLTHRALGGNLVCVILDDAFMREDEPDYVARVLSSPPLEIQLKIIDVRTRFLEAMKGLEDAEEKRKRFRALFYQVLAETAKREDCKYLVQGTIKADIDETVRGIKTQHNVLEQLGISPMNHYGFKIVEPLLDVYKGDVRLVARYLGLPEEFSERQPFPGPGLSVRAVGEVSPEKLETVKRATAIVEAGLVELGPSQYFAVVLRNKERTAEYSTRIRGIAADLLNTAPKNVRIRVFDEKATGMREGRRQYGDVVGVGVRSIEGESCQPSVHDLLHLQEKIIEENPSITRVFYEVKGVNEKKLFAIGIRSVETTNFLTAQVSEIPWMTLNLIAEKVLKKDSDVAAVYYDVTPKPPATIEME